MNSKRFQFALATPADDAQLRHRMASDWMRGNLSVSFRREPSYFAACAVQGDTTQVFCCRDTATNSVVLVGSRSIRQAYINGIPRPLGYLGDIRLAPEYRKSTVLGRAVRYCRELHQEDPVPMYFGVILEGNRQALDAFTTPRAGLPTLIAKGRIFTPAIHLDKSRRALHEPGLSFAQANADQMPDVFAFLTKELREKQFAPVVESLAKMPGLEPEHFLLAIRDHRIVGCCAGWDQRSFRQTHIEKYSTGFSILRPFYNLAAKLTPLKRLPDPGQPAPYLYLSFVATERNDPDIFRALLREFYIRHRTGPWHYVIAGLHEQDPLASELEDYRSIPAAGCLYTAHYEDGADAVASLDDRIPYIEMATV